MELIVIIVAGLAVYTFVGLSTKTQVEKIKKWLLYDVTKVEIELGSGTGKIKLHTVYDLFITKFPVTAKLVTFETFSLLVDSALDNMRKMFEDNKNIEALVKGE